MDVARHPAAAAAGSHPVSKPFDPVDAGAPGAEWRAPRWVNRVPTPQELLELSARVYKHSRRLYSEADAQGLRVYHDDRIDGSDVRVVLLVPSWFPRPHVSFDTVLGRLEGDTVSVVVVVRGTVRDLVGNTIANLQLLFNKLIDDQYLPEAATDATKVMQGWLLELLARHPELRPAVPHGGAAGGFGGPEWTAGGVGGAAPRRRLKLDVSITGHSLGGLIAEAATVESARFAEAHGMRWRCISFESPGLPEHYHRAALRQRPQPGAWDQTIVGYLAAPNPINMLYPHVGTIYHVLSQWEQTWSHVARCVGADALRIAGWVAVASFTGSAIQQMTGSRRREEEEEQQRRTPSPARAAQPVIASVLETAGAGAARAGRALVVSSGPAIPGGLTRQQCLANPIGPIVQGGQPLGTATADGAAIASTAVAAAAAALQGAAGAASRSASVGGAVVAAASGATQQVLRQVGMGLPLGTLAGWLLSGGGPIGLAKCLAGVLGVEVEELVAQHGLGAMRPCFDSNTGELHERYCRRMKSWPHLGDRGEVVLKAVQQVARWTLPSFLCHDNMGVWTMLSRTAMVEARCSRLAGYEPEERPGDVAFDRLYDFLPEEVAPVTAGDAAGDVRLDDVAPEDLAAPDAVPPSLRREAMMLGDPSTSGLQPLSAEVTAGARRAGAALVGVGVDGAPLPGLRMPLAPSLDEEEEIRMGSAVPAAAANHLAAAQEQEEEVAGSVALPPAAAAAAAAAARAAAAAAAARHVVEREAAAVALAEAEGRVRALEEEFIGTEGAPGVRRRAEAIDELARRRAALAAVSAALAERRAAAGVTGGSDTMEAPLPAFASPTPAQQRSPSPFSGGGLRGVGGESESSEDYEAAAFARHEARRQRRRSSSRSIDAAAVVGDEQLPLATAAMEVDGGNGSGPSPLFVQLEAQLAEARRAEGAGREEAEADAAMAEAPQLALA